MNKDLCVRERACVSVFLCSRALLQNLYFCVVLCSACVIVVEECVCAASVCFILPPGVQCSLAVVKFRDDTVGEGSVITATSPSPPLHLSIFAFMYSHLSLLWLVVCGLY